MKSGVPAAMCGEFVLWGWYIGWQELAVAVAVGWALWTLGRRLRKFVAAGSTPGCGGCSGCSASEPITITPLEGVAFDGRAPANDSALPPARSAK